MRLFVDTSAWFALYDKGDGAHGSASRFWKELRRKSARFVTTEHVFGESITLVRARGGHTAACQLGNFLLTSQIVEIADVPAQTRARAWEVFVKYSDKDFSFTDCTSFVVMRELGLTDAFTFDDHFAQMGFNLRPSRG